MGDDSGTVEHSECYNLFKTTTGSGKENWIIKVYGDKTVWVSMNGQVIQDRKDTALGNATGAVGFGSSPGASFDHAIFELRFPASQGFMKMNLKDPTSSQTKNWYRERFGSDAAKCPLQLATDPNDFGAKLDPAIDMWDPKNNASLILNATCNATLSANDPSACNFFDPCMPPHRYVVDGEFGDENDVWEACIPPAIGKFSLAYFDFVLDSTSPTGGWLYILSDWIAQETSAVSPDCFNMFQPVLQNILQNTFFRSNALRGTATARILIPAECAAIL